MPGLQADTALSFVVNTLQSSDGELGLAEREIAEIVINQYTRTLRIRPHPACELILAHNRGRRRIGVPGVDRDLAPRAEKDFGKYPDTIAPLA